MRVRCLARGFAAVCCCFLSNLGGAGDRGALVPRPLGGTAARDRLKLQRGAIQLAALSLGVSLRTRLSDSPLFLLTPRRTPRAFSSAGDFGRYPGTLSGVLRPPVRGEGSQGGGSLDPSGEQGGKRSVAADVAQPAGTVSAAEDAAGPADTASAAAARGVEDPMTTTRKALAVAAVAATEAEMAEAEAAEAAAALDVSSARAAVAAAKKAALNYSSARTAATAPEAVAFAAARQRAWTSAPPAQPWLWRARLWRWRLEGPGGAQGRPQEVRPRPRP